MSPGPWNWKAQRYYANNNSLLAAGNWGLNGPRTIADAEVCAHAPTDLRALLDEVERLHADPLPAARWVREVERAAFARGAEAMRTAAIAVASKRANLQRLTDSDMAWGRSTECILDELRHLPVPEDT